MATNRIAAALTALALGLGAGGLAACGGGDGDKTVRSFDAAPTPPTSAGSDNKSLGGSPPARTPTQDANAQPETNSVGR